MKFNKIGSKNICLKHREYLGKDYETSFLIVCLPYCLSVSLSVDGSAFCLILYLVKVCRVSYVTHHCLLSYFSQRIVSLASYDLETSHWPDMS